MRIQNAPLPFSHDDGTSAEGGVVKCADLSSLCRTALAGIVLLGLSVPGVARAQQLDTNPPLPDVLLMIDNSGSMERMIDGSLPESTPANTCNCTDTAGLAVCNFAQSPLPVANRWNGVQQALTGTLQNGFNCIAMPRDTAGSTFASEYQIAGIAPYDTGYYLPFHRMVANDTSTNPSTPCVVAPGSLPGAASSAGVGPTVAGNGAGGSATAYLPSYIINRKYGTASLSPTAPACTFAQLNNGAIDSMTNFMRFGMMTFDQDPSSATGVSTGPPFTTAAQPFTGMWSYFPGWDTGAACTYLGNPVNCAAQTMMAVGARNPAAPPWEGRLVYFPTTNDLATQNTNNLEIQRIVLASRPYGATPLAGMFTGAKYFFWTDPKGPLSDPFVTSNPACRSQYIILLTDGAPNLDMQTACSSTGSPNGVCPFPLPQTTAATLFNNGLQGAHQFVSTFVIGFAVSSFQDNGTLVHCSDFATNGSLASTCNCSDPSLPQQSPYGACCELQCIARNGGTNNAYFADTQGDLQNALNSILALIAKNATTRTVPAFSQVATNILANQTTPQTNASIFLASFDPTPFKPWSGDIQRQRYQCTINGQGNGYTVPSPTIVSASGDDFGMNLNSNQGPARRFIAFQPAVESDGHTVDSTATIRPYVSATVGDKLGLYSATTYSGSAATVVSSITPAAFGSACTSGYPYVSTSTGATVTMSSALCATMLLDYLFGQASFAGQPSDFAWVSRYGNALGDIYHATPAVVGPPGGLLQDPLYVGFRSAWQARRQVVYAATNDGLLHAFWADETTLENNEMWAMAPPDVMADVAGSYPSSHLLLLDGAPVVKDVVWDRNATTTASNAWHTMLVAGYGSQGQGYYAVDVTNPDATSLGTGIPTDPPPPGPVFRWQLTKLPSPSTYQIFGLSSATPAITTLFMDPGDGLAREIGVAILPGGKDGPPTTNTAPGCQRVPAVKTPNAAPAGTRSYVRCWGAGGVNTARVNGRSLSIVRIDTGEIIRVFVRAADVPNTDLLATANPSRIIDTQLDSPMTGTPLVFPADVGADASKIFVGDEDGTIWRFDVSSPLPSNWKGAIFSDLYNTTTGGDAGSATAWADGQPFAVPPVLSLDPNGLLVINAATGTTDQYDTTGTELLYSITEQPSGSAFVNWWASPVGASALFHPGERVSGPMTVFNGTLFFSTYSAGESAAGSTACSTGLGKIWGLDFETPKTTSDRSQGGAIELPSGSTLVANLPETSLDPTLGGAVIPGVSIRATPACANLGTGAADQYVPGATHASPQNFTSGSFSLFTQVGKSSTNGVAGPTPQLQIALPTPIAPTVIDSWAAVVQ